VNRRLIASAVCLTAFATTVAGCSDESTSSSPQTTSTPKAQNAGGVPKEVTTFLASAATNPTDIVLKEPLAAPPEHGKLVVSLVTPQPVTQVESKAAAAAAKALGWNHRAIPIEPTADGIQKAFQTAFELKPQPVAITLTGYPKVAYEAQLKKAKSRGIAVITSSATDPPATGDGIEAVIDGPAQVREAGRTIAAFIVADSKGKAHIALFGISSYPILGEFAAGFKDGLAKWCPDCTVKDVDQQATDVGTKTPQSVVSTFQGNPDLNYAVFSFGDMTIGVDAALEAAGLSSKVKIAGEAATPANIKAVKAGHELAWTGFAAPVFGWRLIDAAARIASGGDATVASTTNLPAQLITPENVDKLVVDKDGYYVGVDNYEGQFRQLWGVS
jgi:ribose transport system substrate-binding protein